MLRKSLLIGLLLGGGGVIIALAWLFQSESVYAANNDAQTEGAYPAVGLHAGVWNDGQAALWDLNVLDHFHYFGPEERARGYRPEQPIQFSHVRHAQLNKMECQYCHWTVNKSPYAAIPEVETCLGCHQFVLGTSEERKKEISKLNWYTKNSGLPYYPGKDPSTPYVDSEDGTGNEVILTNQSVPIPWEKVTVMPNYVRFNHKRHVKAGVSCHSCHGQVAEMDVVERVSSMKMGWCLSCHREEGASIDCYTCHY